MCPGILTNGLVASIFFAFFKVFLAIFSPVLDLPLRACTLAMHEERQSFASVCEQAKCAVCASSPQSLIL
jgi:hypothetical protein